MDGGITGRDRAHADGTLGVQRREFVESAMGLEHVAFGADFARLAERAAGEQRVLSRRSRAGQAPAHAAFLKDDRGFVGGDDTLRDGGVFLDVGGDLGVLLLGELKVGGEFVGFAEGGLVGRHARGQHRERAEVRAAGEQERAL